MMCSGGDGDGDEDLYSNKVSNSSWSRVIFQGYV